MQWLFITIETGSWCVRDLGVLIRISFSVSSVGYGLWGEWLGYGLKKGVKRVV